MKKKAKKEFGEATRASVKKEMAKPRMSKSAREGEINLAAARIAPRKLLKAISKPRFLRSSATHFGTRSAEPPIHTAPPANH